MVCACKWSRLILRLRLHSELSAAYEQEYRLAKRRCLSVKTLADGVPDDVNSTPGTYKSSRMRARLFRVVLCPLHVCHCVHVPTLIYDIQCFKFSNSHPKQNAAWRRCFLCYMKQLIVQSPCGGRSMTCLWPQLPLCVLASLRIRTSVFSSHKEATSQM